MSTPEPNGEPTPEPDDGYLARAVAQRREQAERHFGEAERVLSQVLHCPVPSGGIALAMKDLGYTCAMACWWDRASAELADPSGHGVGCCLRLVARLALRTVTDQDDLDRGGPFHQALALTDIQAAAAFHRDLTRLLDQTLPTPSGQEATCTCGSPA